MNPRSTLAPVLRCLSWAAYLACSWTWCIGMFLPVLLAHDYGLAGWVVFAIPNVIGAAAFAWVLSRPGASERLVAAHRPACVGFSAVTLAFQAFFLIWMTSAHIIPRAWSIAAVGGGTALALFLRRRRTLDLLLALIVLGVSTAVLVHGLNDFTIADWHGRKDMADLYWLAPVCIFGFSLCPYLDVTFHEARQAISSAQSKWAFGVGFGLFFLAMIILTLLYEGDFVRGEGFGSFGLEGLRTWVALHISAQIGFTWAAHLRALPRSKTSDLPLWLGAAVLVGLAAKFLSQQQYFDRPHDFMYTGEAIYRLFMAFYGLVFPAYVWMFMLPLGGRSPAQNPRNLLLWTLGLALAAPMFWMGFIQGQMKWLAPGIAIVLLARAGGQRQHLEHSARAPYSRNV